MHKLKDVEILQPSMQDSDQMLLPHLSKTGEFGDSCELKHNHLSILHTDKTDY
jgi:hypothetical protein